MNVAGTEHGLGAVFELLFAKPIPNSLLASPKSFW